MANKCDHEVVISDKSNMRILRVGVVLSPFKKRLPARFRIDNPAPDICKQTEVLKKARTLWSARAEAKSKRSKRDRELQEWCDKRPSREIQAWLALRKREALKIDPRTAEVTWAWRGLDPYGVETDVPPELDCRSREWFARRPGSDIWVWSGDLPASTIKALRERRPRSKR